MKENFVRVLGSADWYQYKDNDHSCYTVNDKVLIDACPSVVTNLYDHGVDPLQMQTLCITHIHADHYMGLAPLLHHWHVRRQMEGMENVGRLTIVGPKATLRKAVELTFQFVFHSESTYQQIVETEMPLIIEIEGGDQWETPDFFIETFASDHAVPGLCYRITDKTTNHVVGFSGDTRYLSSFAQFYRDADLLVHEASFADCPTTEQNNGVCRHSSSFDAVRVCQEANVKRALFTHTNTTRQQAALAVGKNLLHIPVEWATPYNVYTF